MATRSVAGTVLLGLCAPVSGLSAPA